MQRLGEYEVVRAIARGGMGSVFEVRHPRSNATYAAKVILRSEDAAARERFTREATLLARCDRHPGVVKVHTIGEAPGKLLYMILDLVRGEDLGALLNRERRLEPRRAAAIAREVADALAFVHAQGVIHRDVKPSNVLLDEKGHAHVTDFGVATATDLEKMTRTGMFVGTLRWVSPEQACGGEVGPPTDVFAVGCILFRALTGDHIAEDLDGPVYLAWLSGPMKPADIRLLAPLAPETLVRIVEKALAKDPKDRYPDARLLALDLAAFLEDRPVSVEGPRAPRRGLIAAGVALAVLAGASSLALPWTRGAPAPAAGAAVEPLAEPAARLARARSLLAAKDGPGALAALEGLAESAAVLETKGDVAALASDWKGAAELYGRALAGDPASRAKRCEAAALAGDEKTSSADLRLLLAGGVASDPRLAPALYRRALVSTDVPARRRDFETALLLAPPPRAFAREVALALNDIATEEARVWSDTLVANVRLTDDDMKRFHKTYALLYHAYQVDRDLPKEGFGSLLKLLRVLQKTQDRKRLCSFANIFLKDWPNEPLWLYLLAWGEHEGTADDERDALLRLQMAADGYGPAPPDEEKEVAHLAAEIAALLMDVAATLRVDDDMERVAKMADRSGEGDIQLRVVERWRWRKEWEKARAALAKAKALPKYKGEMVPGHVIAENEIAILWDEGKKKEVRRRTEKYRDKPWGPKLFARYAKLDGRWQDVVDSVDPATDDAWCLDWLVHALWHLGRKDEALTAFRRLETLKARGELKDDVGKLREMLGVH